MLRELRLSTPNDRRKAQIAMLLARDEGFCYSEALRERAELKQLQEWNEQDRPVHERAPRTRLPGGELTCEYLAFFSLFLEPLCCQEDDQSELADRFVIACTGGWPVDQFCRYPSGDEDESEVFPDSDAVFDRYDLVKQLASGRYLRTRRGFLLSDMGAPDDAPYTQEWLESHVLAYAASDADRAKLQEYLAPVATGESPPKKAKN